MIWNKWNKWDKVWIKCKQGLWSHVNIQKKIEFEKNKENCMTKVKYGVERCWRTIVKNMDKVKEKREKEEYEHTGGYVKVECKDCNNVHDVWVSN